MGHTRAKVTFSNPFSSKSEEMELFVDTGSTFTWVSKLLLERLEVRPQTEWTFKTIDGRVLKRSVGEAVVSCLGESATTKVVFAEEGDANVMGAYALEGLMLEVDPATEQLRKTGALLAIRAL
jgi:predicted aspartyl protease